MGSWYLGPLGDLRVLPVRAAGPEVTPVRYGGIHQALSGARVQDTTGIRNEYKFSFDYLDQTEYFWLDALYTGHVPGPFRLIDPLRKNRFTIRSTAGELTLGMEGTLTYDRSWPTAVPIPGRSYVLTGWSGASLDVPWEDKTGTAVFPNESLTASVYARCGSTHTASLQLQMCDADLAVLSTQSVAMAITATWQRFTITRTTPATAAAVKMHVILGSANTPVYLAAPQLEAGSAATSWEPGGGAPVVVFSDLTAGTPQSPLRHVSVTLLEA